jgi:hypothetical protein
MPVRHWIDGFFSANTEAALRRLLGPGGHVHGARSSRSGSPYGTRRRRQYAECGVDGERV